MNNRWFTAIYVVGFVISYVVLRNILRISRGREKAVYGWGDVFTCLAMSSLSWVMIVGIGIGELISRIRTKPPKWL